MPTKPLEPKSESAGMVVVAKVDAEDDASVSRDLVIASVRVLLHDAGGGGAGCIGGFPRLALMRRIGVNGGHNSATPDRRSAPQPGSSLTHAVVHLPPLRGVLPLVRKLAG
jgi:hypothetical protein